MDTTNSRAREKRTYFDPTWHTESEEWTGDSVDDLRERIERQEATNHLETRWRLVRVRRSQAGRAVVVVKRQVYCDPPDIDPLVVSICRKYGRVQRSR